MLCRCFESGGKLLLCGNGGSAADCGHIAGELIKGFLLKRQISKETKKSFKSGFSDRGSFLADQLQQGLPVIDLTSHNPLITAIANDMDASLIFAQQVMACGKKGDVILGISSSGNAQNVIDAIITGRVLGLQSIALTGNDGGCLLKYADTTIRVKAETTPDIQELHQPVYHCLCQMIESYFFD